MSKRGLWLTQLSDTPSSERGVVLMSLVSSALKAKLLMSDFDSLPVDKSYFELGLTSLGAVELQENLEMAINHRIDATSLYNHPTVDNLVGYLRSEVLVDYFGAQSASSKNTEQDVVVKQKNDNEYTGQKTCWMKCSTISIKKSLSNFTRANYG
ncbi:MAG: acyl carrier protein [Gammaproteobacteria bacterium]|nr:acyl carrier protein [Gammaproteobacteria bacterium]